MAGSHPEPSGLSERCDAWAGSSRTENVSQDICQVIFVTQVEGDGKLNKR